MNHVQLLAVLAVTVYAPVAVHSLVCYQCNLATSNVTGDGPCEITVAGSGAVASVVECANGEVCYTEMAMGRGCRPTPAGFSGGIEVMGAVVVCNNTDVCNNGPLFNLSCYGCSQSTREDCEVNSGNMAANRVTLESCHYADYCNYGYHVLFGGSFVSFHRRCVSVAHSVCMENGCDIDPVFGGGDCQACCSSNDCNTATEVADPIMCYHCAATGPNAEANCAVNSANMNAARVTELSCPHSDDVCLTKKETKNGAVVSFVRTCFDKERCRVNSGCDAAEGGVCSDCCSDCTTIPVPMTPVPTTPVPMTPVPTTPVATNTTDVSPSSSSVARVWLSGVMLFAAGGAFL